MGRASFCTSCFATAAGFGFLWFAAYMKTLNTISTNRKQLLKYTIRSHQMLTYKTSATRWHLDNIPSDCCCELFSCSSSFESSIWHVQQIHLRILAHFFNNGSSTTSGSCNRLRKWIWICSDWAHSLGREDVIQSSSKSKFTTNDPTSTTLRTFITRPWILHAKI